MNTVRERHLYDNKQFEFGTLAQRYVKLSIKVTKFSNDYKSYIKYSAIFKKGFV